MSGRGEWWSLRGPVLGRASSPLNHVSGPIVTLVPTSLPHLGLMDPYMQEFPWQTSPVKAWGFPGLWAKTQSRVSSSMLGTHVLCNPPQPSREFGAYFPEMGRETWVYQRPYKDSRAMRSKPVESEKPQAGRK